MTTQTTAPARRPGDGSGGAGSTWRIPLGMLILTVFPLVAGSLRIIEIAGGPALMPPNPRTVAVPIPLVLHVAGAAVYVTLGAFQFPARIRRRHRVWHSRAGRVLVGAGLMVAGSGLWMTLAHPDAPGGPLLWTVRIVVSTVTAASLILGLAAIRRRDLAAHRAWMIRGYAHAVAAGTQMFTQGVGEAVFGSSDLSIGLSVSAGWMLNAAIAEWIIRRPVRQHIGRTRPVQAGT